VQVRVGAEGGKGGTGVAHRLGQGRGRAGDRRGGGDGRGARQPVPDVAVDLRRIIEGDVAVGGDRAEGVGARLDVGALGGVIAVGKGGAPEGEAVEADQRARLGGGLELDLDAAREGSGGAAAAGSYDQRVADLGDGDPE